MDPNTSNNQPNFDLPPLPPVNAEQTGEVPALPEAPAEQEQAKQMEQPGTAQPQSSMPPAAMPGLPTNDPAASDPATQSPLPVVNTSPLIADDVDLIEKEWVNKAKAIVEHTRDDPYKQNKEINQVKADYIKKRYNKDIKVNEG